MSLSINWIIIVHCRVAKPLSYLVYYYSLLSILLLYCDLSYYLTTNFSLIWLSCHLYYIYFLFLCPKAFSIFSIDYIVVIFYFVLNLLTTITWLNSFYLSFINFDLNIIFYSILVHTSYTLYYLLVLPIYYL